MNAVSRGECEFVLLLFDGGGAFIFSDMGFYHFFRVVV